ncbi:MAG TPA: bifunctional UDP-N-acetylglucosamine diphosphorylase/glucosamine-1-phosphate N-acetyltransferase GlmU, partial [Planctomycetaceae bacterium]|nr:bifunctional UDP-N-acetylglucosamine diphosphorylase/glucosamine-1-phosphate N-acetyltransferase GlmU [Planctomycetaceae bacterium]
MSDTSPIAVVLAAGKGTRMNSDLPKVLHEAAGKTLLAWVLDALSDAGCHDQIIVVGYGGDSVRTDVG